MEKLKMNILAGSYAILIFLCLGLGRKPWLYAISKDNPILRSAVAKFALISLFSTHSIIAIWFATQIYTQFI